MKSFLILNGLDKITWLNNNLPYPRSDLSGNCNFFAGSAGFMETGSQSCTFVAKNLANSCSSILNPTFLTSYLRVNGGPDGMSDIAV